jgi:hypothetical protein
MLMPEMVSAAVPLLLSEICRTADAVPIGVVANPIPVADKLAALPPPLSATFCGEPNALSVMLTAALSAPDAAGLKVTVITHEPAAATLVPHVLVCVNELVLVPVMATLVMGSAAELLLVSVTAWVVAATPIPVVGNVRLAVESTTALPVPLIAIVCGEAGALSATLSVAVSAPAAVGLNVMAMVQLAPIATLVPHVLVWLNEVAFVPVMLMLETASAAVPELLSVILGAVNDAPTHCAENDSELADRAAFGAVAVPVPPRTTNCGDP